jgi:hypothetical protein
MVVVPGVEGEQQELLWDDHLGESRVQLPTLGLEELPVPQAQSLVLLVV